jgi:cytochrome P450
VLVNAATETTAWSKSAVPTTGDHYLRYFTLLIYLPTLLGLSLGTFYILNQPSTLAKLREELKSTVTDSSQLPPLATLEQLPYLNATIAETLRHSYGPVSRLPRTHTQDTVQLHSVQKLSSSKAGVKQEEVDYIVPPGYPISMTSVHVHMNPDLFPNPQSFSPERWLDSEGRRRKDLDKYILSFSKGTRQCLGIKYASFLNVQYPYCRQAYDLSGQYY